MNNNQLNTRPAQERKVVAVIITVAGSYLTYIAATKGFRVLAEMAVSKGGDVGGTIHHPEEGLLRLGRLRGVLDYQVMVPLLLILVLTAFVVRLFLYGLVAALKNTGIKSSILAATYEVTALAPPKRYTWLEALSLVGTGTMLFAFNSQLATIGLITAVFMSCLVGGRWLLYRNEPALFPLAGDEAASQ